MNNEMLKNLTDKVDSMADLVLTLESVVTGLKRRSEDFMKSNQPIPPGTYPKISYDNKGLVIKGTTLDTDDIPDLPVKKITGLKKMLDGIPSNEEFQNLKDSLIDKITMKDSIKSGIGMKFVFDEHGLITEQLEVVPGDIPDLPISKIEGLVERLNILELGRKVSPVEKNVINPGTHTKITYDSNGKVVRGDTLSLTDLPSEILNRVSWVEGQIPNMASRDLLENTIIEVKNKVIGNTPIKGGTFTKVTVDSKGLVTNGSKLELSDLPSISIEDIVDLHTTLLRKANHEDFTQLQNQISILQSNNQLVELKSIVNQLAMKADKDTVNIINNQVSTLQNEVINLNKRLPHEMLEYQVREMMNTLNTLTDRILSIEHKLGLQGEP